MIMKVLIVHLAFILFCNISASAQTIQMEKVGRTYRLPCTVNGLPLQFILDTGADKVIISLAEAMFMLKNGYLDKNSLLGTEYFRLANGEITEGTSVILGTVVIGGLTIRNVQASIIHSADAPLLFGQSALEKLGKVTIDYQKDQLIIGERTEVYATEKGSAIDYFLNGNNKFKLGDLQSAIQDFSKAIELNPFYSEAFNNRGAVKESLGRHIEAIKDYNLAIEIGPEFSMFFFNRAISMNKIGNFLGAIQDFNKAIEIDSTNCESFYYRGIVKNVMSNDKGAIEDYSKAINIDPKHVLSFYNRGTSKMKMGDFKGAIKDCTKAIEINPKFSKSFYNRATSKMNLGDYKGAILDYNKAIEIDPIFSEAYNNRAVSKINIGDDRGAIQDCTQAIKLNPKYSDAFFNRGISRFVLNEVYEACIDWRKAGELGHNKAYDTIKNNCK